MENILTLSSQGQIVIPSKVRSALGIKPGSKIKLILNKLGSIPKAILIPQPNSWTDLVTGLGKGVWGEGEKYIEKERNNWTEK